MGGVRAIFDTVSYREQRIAYGHTSVVARRSSLHHDTAQADAHMATKRVGAVVQLIEMIVYMVCERTQSCWRVLDRPWHVGTSYSTAVALGGPGTVA